MIPPGPKNRFLLGHIPEFVSDPFGFLIRSAQEYGGVIRINPTIGQTYLISQPDAIEYVLVTNNRNFIRPKLYQLVKPILGNGIVLNEGESWLRQRRLMQPAFHRDRIMAYGEAMVKYGELMLNKWQHGEVRDIHHDMMHVTLQIVAKSLFGVDITEEANEATEAFKASLKELNVRLSMPVRLPENVPSLGNLRFRRATGMVDKLIYGFIKERRDNGDNGDLLSMLLQAQDEDGSRMNDEQLRDEARTLFFTGHETTATLLSWTCYLLGQNSAVAAKVYDEVSQVLEGRNPTAKDLPKLRYTDMVIKESLRLYPPGWLLARQNVKECEIGGYTIPAGSQVWISPLVTHRDPKLFENPESFWPERWETEATKNLPRFAYFPFGGGPRQCIGSNFGLLEAILIIAMIVQRFQLKVIYGQKVEPELSGTLRPKNGIKMIINKRQPAFKIAS